MYGGNERELDNFIKQFRILQEKLRVSLLQVKAATLPDLKLKIDTVVKKNEIQIREITKSWVKKDLKDAYDEGAKFAEKKIGGHTGQSKAADDKLTIVPYMELADNITKLSGAVIKDIKKRIDNKTTVAEASEAIKDVLKRGHYSTIKYRSGALVRSDKYAEMLARTSRIETANKGMIARTQELGRDLVIFIALDNCCHICKRFHRKVFSVSGKDKRFPWLYGPSGPYAKGYKIVHPNCRCEVLPFLEELYGEKELGSIQKESNMKREYDLDDKIMKKYRESQEKNRQRNTEDLEYIDMSKSMGSERPYKTIGGYRRARRMDKLPPKLKAYFDNRKKNA